MEARAASFTVAAVLGTGLATLGFALSGVSALGDDLHAAALTPAATAPVLSPSEESRNTPPAASAPSTGAATALRLQQACDRKHGAGQHHNASARPAPEAVGAGSVAKEY